MMNREKILEALAEAYRLQLERQTGEKMKVTVREGEPWKEETEPAV